MVLNVHILGSGNAARKHREAIEQLPDMYSISDYESADIIDVCTPPYLHKDQANLAMNHWPTGKNVILEKPPALSLDEIDLLAETEEMNQCRIFPIFQYRDIPIKPGTETSVYKRGVSYYSGWRGNYAKASGGCIASHMVHDISRIVHQYGQIDGLRTVAFTTYFDYYEMGVEVETSAVVIFYVGDMRFERCVYMFPDITHNIASNPGYVEYFRSLDSSPDFEEMRHIMEVVTACYYSAYTEQPVKLPLSFEHPFYSGWQEQMKQHQHKSGFSRKTPLSPDRLSA